MRGAASGAFIAGPGGPERGSWPLAAPTDNEADLTEADRLLYAGMIRLHVLSRAARRPTLAADLAEELARRGYRVGPGMLYTLLHNLETQGLLTSEAPREGASARRAFRATPAGRRALKTAAERVDGLMKDLVAD